MTLFWHEHTYVQSEMVCCHPLPTTMPLSSLHPQWWVYPNGERIEKSSSRLFHGPTTGDHTDVDQVNIYGAR